MEYIAETVLYLHIAAGLTTLLMGPVAIYTNQRNLRIHRPAGKLFYWAMLVVCVTAVLGFLKHADQISYQFLLGIAVFVWAGTMRGVRALQLMKRRPVLPLDYWYTAILGLLGGSMCIRALVLYASGLNIAFPILFGVFGAASVAGAVANLGYFRKAVQMDRLDWLAVHVSSMIGAFIASTTAFTVNAAPFLPWYLQWFGPTLLLVPVQVFFGRRIRRQKDGLQGSLTAPDQKMEAST